MEIARRIDAIIDELNAIKKEVAVEKTVTKVEDITRISPTSRQGVIEKAKEDVVGLLNENHPYASCTAMPGVWFTDEGSIFFVLDKAEFIVNKEKRSVVCLIKNIETGVIRLKGISKCAPNDCFNVHIGKAIALRRALGLDVPETYLNAPQPEKAEVGDVVRTDTYGHLYELAKRYTEADVIGLGRAFWIAGEPAWLGEKQFTIIDDSRDE